MAKVANLLHSSKSGIVFGDATKKLFRKEDYFYAQCYFSEKLAKLLDILNELANTDDYKF